MTLVKNIDITYKNSYSIAKYRAQIVNNTKCKNNFIKNIFCVKVVSNRCLKSKDLFVISYLDVNKISFLGMATSTNQSCQAEQYFQVVDSFLFTSMYGDIKKNILKSSSPLNQEYIKSLKGWNLLGTEEEISGDLVHMLDSAIEIYTYDSNNKTFKLWKNNNGKINKDIVIKARHGFWLYK
jgi:hypothetical protein